MSMIKQELKKETVFFSDATNSTVGIIVTLMRGSEKYAIAVKRRDEWVKASDDFHKHEAIQLRRALYEAIGDCS